MHGHREQIADLGRYLESIYSFQLVLFFRSNRHLWLYLSSDFTLRVPFFILLLRPNSYLALACPSPHRVPRPRGRSRRGLQRRILISIKLDLGICLRVRQCELNLIITYGELILVSLYSPGVLPEGQNSPQKCKYDLYNEAVSVEFDY